MLEFIYFVLYLMVFIFGSCIASFLNVIIYRLPQDISISRGRSFCPCCKTQLKSYDLFPIFSWLFLKGKCRSCGKKISIRYPLVELLGGIVSVLTFFCYGFNIKSIIVFTFFSILICIAFIDLDTMEIPDVLNFALGIPCVLSVFLFKEITIKERLIGLVCVSGFLLLMAIFIKGSFGMGDVILMAFSGFFIGHKNIILALFIAILITGSYAIIKLSTKKLKRTDHIAFGPCLCIGIFVSHLYGEQLINAYLNLLGIK